MRLASLTWASDVALLLEAAKETKIDLEAWAVSELNDENVEDCIRSLNSAEVDPPTSLPSGSSLRPCCGKD